MAKVTVSNVWKLLTGVAALVRPSAPLPFICALRKLLTRSSPAEASAANFAARTEPLVGCTWSVPVPRSVVVSKMLGRLHQRCQVSYHSRQLTRESCQALYIPWVRSQSPPALTRPSPEVLGRPPPASPLMLGRALSSSRCCAYPSSPLQRPGTPRQVGLLMLGTCVLGCRGGANSNRNGCLASTCSQMARRGSRRGTLGNSWQLRQLAHREGRWQKSADCSLVAHLWCALRCTATAWLERPTRCAHSGHARGSGFARRA